MCSEFGDKSQISALALSTTQSISSVVLGGCAAQISCIVITLIVGQIIEKYCTEKLTGLIGGILFILFGLTELYEVLY